MKRVLLAAVAVNKAADYITSADEVPRPAAARPATAIDPDDDTQVRGRRPKTTARKRAKTTLEQLRAHEALLDAALRRSYERFRNGEVTVAEMDRERDHLIRAFNERVMGENIRYRSMLRSHPNGGRQGRR